jgi:hypothetical protein
LKAARGFLEPARELEAIHRRETAPVPKGIVLDSAWIDRVSGRIVSATVLEAVAVELALKARLTRAGVKPPNIHNHLKLFALLPQADRDEVEKEYQGRRHPMMRKTFACGLAYPRFRLSATRSPNKKSMEINRHPRPHSGSGYQRTRCTLLG